MFAVDLEISLNKSVSVLSPASLRRKYLRNGAANTEAGRELIEELVYDGFPA